jgi:hypothetical protein
MPGVRSAQDKESFSQTWASNKQVTRTIPRVATVLWLQQDTSRHLLISTDCRDTDPAAYICDRPTRMVTPSGAPSQSLVDSYKKQDFTACMYFNFGESLVTSYQREKPNNSDLAVQTFIV